MRFADLPLSHSIDLSRQGKRTLGAVKQEIGPHLAKQGFLTMVTRLGGAQHKAIGTESYDSVPIFLQYSPINKP